MSSKMANSQMSIDPTRLLSTRGVLYVMAAVGVAGVQQLQQRLFASGVIGQDIHLVGLFAMLIGSAALFGTALRDVVKQDASWSGVTTVLLFAFAVVGAGVLFGALAGIVMSLHGAVGVAGVVLVLLPLGVATGELIKKVSN